MLKLFDWKMFNWKIKKRIVIIRFFITKAARLQFNKPLIQIVKDFTVLPVIPKIRIYIDNENIQFIGGAENEI